MIKLNKLKYRQGTVRRTHRLLLATAASLLVVSGTSCTRQGQSRLTAQNLETDSMVVLDTDSNRRAAYIRREIVTDTSGMPLARDIVVAEPSPDTALENTTRVIASLSSGEGLSAEVRAELANTVVSLTQRTQAVNVLRDSLYRLSEARANGYMTDEAWENGFQTVMRSVEEIAKDGANARLAAAAEAQRHAAEKAKDDAENREKQAKDAEAQAREQLAERVKEIAESKATVAATESLKKELESAIRERDACKAERNLSEQRFNEERDSRQKSDADRLKAEERSSQSYQEAQTLREQLKTGEVRAMRRAALLERLLKQIPLTDADGNLQALTAEQSSELAVLRKEIEEELKR